MKQLAKQNYKFHPWGMISKNGDRNERKLEKERRSARTRSHGRTEPWQAVTRVARGARVSRRCPQIARNCCLLLFSRHTPHASPFHVFSTCPRLTPRSPSPSCTLFLVRASRIRFAPRTSFRFVPRIDNFLIFRLDLTVYLKPYRERKKLCRNCSRFCFPYVWQTIR